MQSLIVESSSRLREANNRTRQRKRHRRDSTQGNAQRRLERWATEVLCKRRFETVSVVLDEIGELEDLGPAKLNGLEFPSSETLAQVGVDLEGVLSTVLRVRRENAPGVFRRATCTQVR